jgi:hypothetical protein
LPNLMSQVYWSAINEAVLLACYFG